VKALRAIASGGQAGDGTVRVVTWADPGDWDAFVLRARDGTIAHRWAWLGIVSASYGHQVVPLAAVRGEELAGVLPLVLMRSRLFGRHLVSMPFVDTGGLCTDGDEAADAALVTAAVNLATASGAQLELRHIADRPIALEPSRHKVTMVVDLSDGADAVWKRIHGNRRSQVRKAWRAGLKASVHGGEAVPDFYRILATNLRDLGSPVHRKRFFRNVMAAFGADARIVLVRDGDRAIGTAMVLIQGDRAVMPWMGSLRSFFPRAPSQLVYWEALRHGIARECRTFDFGRSSPGSGTYEAKREWAAQPVQLYWHRLPGHEADDEAQRWQWATSVWRHMPVPVATAAGAAIRGRLPQ
jgi:FemAB-related protein (PEP-CTERM system-associated)